MLKLVLPLVAGLLLVGLSAAAEPGFRPELLQLELSSVQLRPGATLQFTWHFANVGTAPAPEDYLIFVHLHFTGESAQGAVQYGGDFAPEPATSLWLPGSELVLHSQMVVPASAPAGEYSLYAGLYSPATGDRVTLANRDLPGAPTRPKLASLQLAAAGPTPSEPVTLTFASEPRLRPLAGLFASAAKTESAVCLQNDALTVCLGQDEPLFTQFTFEGVTLPGAKIDRPWQVKYYSERSGKTCRAFPGAGLAFKLEKTTPTESLYSAVVKKDGQAIGRFKVKVYLREAGCRLELREIEAAPGFRLLQVETPPLIGSAAPAGALALTAEGGRLVKLDQAVDGSYTLGYDLRSAWPVVMALEPEAGAALEVDSYDSRLVARVWKTDASTWGGAAVRFNLLAPAKPPAADLVLDDAPGCTLTFATTSTPSVTKTCLALAKRLRRRLKARPNPLYQAFVYKIFCDVPGLPQKDVTTFADALELIKRIHRLTGGAPQVIYLVGWQYKGHDTGYPAVWEVNERAGGRKALLHLIAEAHKYGAIVSFHDNYDDAYQDSPDWDPAVIARDASGHLQKGGIWAGGQSYTISPCRYVRSGAAARRIERTCKLYPVEQTYHIDVLSAVVQRHEFGPDLQANSEQSVKCKLQIIREFNQHGLDVTSEFLTLPFVGPVTHFWHLERSKQKLFAGEQVVPLTSLLLHGKVSYGCGGEGRDFLLDSALFGSTFSADWRKQTPDEEIVRDFYFITVPWLATRGLEVADFECKGAHYKLTYAPGTYVEVDYSTGEYTVHVDHFPLIAGGVCYARQKDRLLVCSLHQREVVVPRTWPEGARLEVRELAGGKAIEWQALPEGLRFMARPLVPYEVLWKHA